MTKVTNSSSCLLNLCNSTSLAGYQGYILLYHLGIVTEAGAHWEWVGTKTALLSSLTESLLEALSVMGPMRLFNPMGFPAWKWNSLRLPWWRCHKPLRSGWRS